MAFRFEPISAASYTEKQGDIISKGIGELSSLAASQYDQYKSRVKDQEYRETILGDLEKSFGSNPILAKQIADNKAKLQAMPTAKLEAAVANWGASALTYLDMKERNPDQPIIAPPPFVPDSAQEYYGRVTGRIAEGKKAASRKAVSDKLSTYDPKTQTAEGLGRNVALDPMVDLEDAETAMKFAERPPEKPKMDADVGAKYAKIGADKNEDKMKRFDALEQERIGINKQLVGIDAVQRRIDSKGATLESMLATGTDEEKAAAQTIKDNPQEVERLRKRGTDLEDILNRANAEGRKKEAFEYEADKAKHSYNYNLVRKEYDAANGAGAYEKFRASDPIAAYQMVKNYKPGKSSIAKENPAKSNNNPAKSSFIEGKKYKDKDGNIAIFKNGKFQPL
jgi:hypothetical protein